MTLDVPLETKKTSTAIHLNPGKEVSYEANLTFDNAVLGDNKEEVKKLLRGVRNWSVEQKSDKSTTQYTVRGSADDALTFSKKYSGSDSPLVVENELKPTTFKNHWMIVITPLDWMPRGEIKIITDHGKFDDGSSEKTWTPGESTVFRTRASTLRTGPVVAAVVIGVLIVAAAVLAYFKRDAIRAWRKKRAEAARQQLLRTGSTEFLRRVKHRRISNGHHSPALRCLRRRADTPLTVVAVASGQKTICSKRPFLQRWRCPLPRSASGHGSGVQSWQRLARCGQQEGKTWFDYPWARAE